VTALVRLFVDDAENETAAVDQYKEALNESIDSGELQEALDFVNDDSVVYIVTGRNTGRGIDGEPEETLSAGAIIGIVVVGSIGMVFISLLLARGREPREVDLSKQDDHMVDLEGIQPGASNDIMVDTSDGEGKPGKKSNKSDESSNAGDSGWSSHGGLSSLDTHSMDEESRNRTMALGGAAVASGVVAGAALVEPNSPSDSSGNLKMTYSELDDAIQKGDWAAVGVTAALLASQSYETGGSSDTHRVSLENATLNPSRAAELDRLVEAGDWEGVVAAAAKFDAQEATHHSDRSGSNPSKEGSSSDVTSGASGSVGSSNSNSLGSGSRTHFTVGTAEGTATTDSNSQSHRKLGEIRKEVDELVRQVVPEEQDNVDEMMLQFQGREEELVETLRSMQERQVVEKSRVEGQKKAKFDVREQAQSNKRELAKKATEVKDDDDENSRKREQDLKEEQEALAQAAEWEAVAQQARNQNASAANDSAAQDAADWAIAQSLNQMSTSKEEPEAFGDDDEEGSV
jgi:type II secretory pathway component PulM